MIDNKTNDNWLAAIKAALTTSSSFEDIAARFSVDADALKKAVRAINPRAASGQNWVASNARIRVTRTTSGDRISLPVTRFDIVGRAYKISLYTKERIVLELLPELGGA